MVQVVNELAAIQSSFPCSNPNQGEKNFVSVMRVSSLVFEIWRSLGGSQIVTALTPLPWSPT